MTTVQDELAPPGAWGRDRQHARHADVIRVADLEIRPAELEVLADGRRVGLTVREFQTLHLQVDVHPYALRRRVPVLARARADDEEERGEIELTIRRGTPIDSMSANGDEVREREMARLRREIRDRSLRGESHEQIVHWLATQEGKATECELALARMLASHHARRGGAGVPMYLEDMGKSFD